MLERVSGLEAGSDFHLAMSPERIDPGRTDYTVRTMPKVVGGLTPACTERAVALYAQGRRHARARLGARDGRAREAAREHLPLGQHRAHERDGDALRPHGRRRLGGRRRGRHEAVRLHALHARARASAATASRSTRSTSPGARAQFDFHTEFIELAGKVNQNMPYFCREKVARALNGQAKPLRGSQRAGPRRGLQAGHRRHARVAGAQADRAAARRGRRRQLPRPARAASCATLGLESVALDAARSRPSDCVVVVTDHSSIDYADLVERAQLVVDFRNATGVGRQRERQGRQAVTVAHRRRRPRLLGAEPRAQHGPRGRARLVLRPLRGEPRRATRRSTRRRASRPTSTTCSNDPSLDAIAVASSVPTHHPLGLRALAAGKHVFIEKPLAAERRGRPRARRGRRGGRPAADGRAPPALPPGARARCTS